MYIDDSGQPHDVRVTVDGEEYQAEANYDSHHDGVLDSVLAETDHGLIEFIDSHHTGDADVLREFDDDGSVVAEAHFDPATGEWIETDPYAPDSAGGAGHTMVVDTAEGDREIGPATVDTSGNGIADTAVVQGEDGSLTMYTDVDGDGKADVEVVISKAGEVTVREHSGEHQWTQTEQGHLDSNGAYVRDGGSGDLTHDDLWGMADEGGGDAAWV